jgi:hypothetical protein
MQWRDADGLEPAAIAEMVDLDGKRVIEVGCGTGRLTGFIAAHATSVYAFEPKRRKRTVLQLADHSGPWPKIAGGCHPARDPGAAIESAGSTGLISGRDRARSRGSKSEYPRRAGPRPAVGPALSHVLDAARPQRGRGQRPSM